MGITMFNINSPYNISGDTLDFVLNNSGVLNSLAQSVPVYLVDKELMDVICPPQIWPQLKPGCVQEMIRSFDEEYRFQLMSLLNENQDIFGWMEDPEFITTTTERFWESVRQKAHGSYVVRCKAIYCQSLSLKEAEEIERRIRIRIPFTRHLGENCQSNIVQLDNVPTLEDMTRCQKILGRLGRITSDPMLTNFQLIIEEHRRLIPRGNNVFICMERIVGAASRIKETWDFRSLDMNNLIEIIFSYYLLHQLVYAYMKTGPAQYCIPWVRVIEEGLVAAFTMSCFNDEHSKAVLRAHLSRKPLDYKVFADFEHYSHSDLQYLLRAWSCNSMRNGLQQSKSNHPSLQHLHVNDLNSSFFSKNSLGRLLP